MGRPARATLTPTLTLTLALTLTLTLTLTLRWVDLRVPANMAIMRCQSQVCTLFREALLAQGFTEIHTPKLGSESEGGAGGSRTDLTLTRTLTRTLTLILILTHTLTRWPSVTSVRWCSRSPPTSSRTAPRP